MLVRLLFVLFAKVALGDNVVRIKGANDFINFSNDVNSGTNYSGTTVYLDSDLSLTRRVEPIGNSSRYFSGTFDGQGHVIRNLKVNSSSQYTGLFGYSNGLAIRNAVLDSSCSITNSFSGSRSYVGGVIGYYYASSEQCNIENNVNMADVTFSGNISGNLFVGGVAGYLYSYASISYSAYVKNCVNYGSVTDSGTVNSGWTELGGVVGLSVGNSIYIQNCLNYGTITHNGTSSYGLIIGGIVGVSCNYTYVENCVNAGRISTQTTASSSNYIGSVVGYVESDTYINYCYYTSDVNASSFYGTGTPSSTTGTSNTPTVVDSDLVSKLNANATSCNWTNWLLNANNVTVTFKMGDNKEVSFSSQIILIPKPVKEGNNFLFWCKDAECTEEFNSEAGSISGTTVLYAKWTPNNYTVTFDFDNGTSVNETFTYDTEIIYPDIKKEGHTLSWDNYHELMPARNIIVTVQWIINNYAVTFDFDNGTTVNDIFLYNTPIEYPKNEDMKREGYIFSRWDKSDIVHMPAQNITITALWSANNYIVTFDANGGNNLSATSMIVTFNSTYGPLPGAERTGYSFNGWFTEKTGGSEVTSSTIFTNLSDITLYAHWTINKYTVSFNFINGTEEEVRALGYNASFVYPADPLRERYIFSGWDKSDIVHMPAQNITITALRKANNYTVAFDVNGGNNLFITSITVTFNSSYGPLPTPTKDGYMFLGWFTDNNESIKSDTIVRIADNHTLHAQWEKTTNQVEIVFNAKDLSKEDVEKIVKKYTDAEFTITEFEEESGEIRVIIKFIKNEDAAMFVRNANELSKDNGDDMVKVVGFVSKSGASFSSLLYPTLLLTSLLWM